MIFMFLSMLLGGANGPGYATPATIAASGTVRETRKVGAFNSIEAGGAFTVVVDARAPATSVVVEADSSIVGKITTEVQGGVLKLGEESGAYNWNSGDIKVTIGVPSLSGLNVSGAGESTVTNVHGAAFSVHLAGAGSATVSGTTNAFTAELDGAASLDAAGLKAHSAHVSISGTGSAKVWASDTLVADVSGVGSIRYYGHPAHVTPTVSGVGSISAGS